MPMLSNKLVWGLALSTLFYTPLTQAKERIYLLAGQSNMMGRGKTQELPSNYKSTPSNVRFYYQGRPKPLAKMAYFGPEVTFAHEVAKAFPNDQHVIIKAVGTGSSIKQWQRGKPLYYSLLRQLQLAMPQYFYSKKQPVEAIVWMQGEQDARSGDAFKYQPQIKQFITSLRTDIAAPNSLVVIGQVNPKAPAFRLLKIVQAGQAQVAHSLPNTVLVTTEGLGTTFDLVHYNAQGQMELGKRLAQAYINAKR
jgi:hypothetical protein